MAKAKQRQENSNRLWGYIRVSTEQQQQDGFSLAYQESKLEAICKAEGLVLAGVTAWVGTGGKRQDLLLEAIEACKREGFGGLVCLRIDRLGRSLVGLAEIVGILTREKLSLLTEEGFEIRGGRIENRLLPIRIGLAEVERSFISQRVKEGMAEAKRQGKHMGRRGKWRREDPAVQEALLLRSQGYTYERVIQRLQALGYKPLSGGQRFYPSHVAYWEKQFGKTL